jgi:hypothetical protein
MSAWGTAAELATAAGTLVLAAATFSSVRSANRAARSAERSLLAGLRPLLFASRAQDPPQQIRWGDDHWASVGGGQAVLELADDIVYLAMSVRNVGSGIAVLRGWRTEPSGPALSANWTTTQARSGGLPAPGAGPVRARG